jgi:hypothetical protein
MFLHNAPTRINNFEDSNLPWIDCEPKGDRMDGSRYYEYEIKHLGLATHRVSISDWRDTPHGGFWMNVTTLQGVEHTTAYECSEFVELAIILRALV